MYCIVFVTVCFAIRSEHIDAEGDFSDALQRKRIHDTLRVYTAGHLFNRVCNLIGKI